tara:strand:+ start:515 stop:1033 length:519 start_codon:yes stop_codon:yes gene_type:complete
MIRIFLLLIVCLLTLSCSGAFKPKKVNTREVSTNAQERARENIRTGRGTSLKGIINRGTNYEFSTSNPMWRASLETLDFLPLNTVDYSGGIIVTDWYSENRSSKESIKITVRFLSNEVRSDSLKIVVHKKICDNSLNCVVNLLKNSIIQDEIQATIIKKAALLAKSDKSKKK